MRISTSQIEKRGVNAILDQQSSLSKTQLQLASGKRILTPADDPSGAAQALELNKSIADLDQYKTNADNAKLRVGLEDSILSQVTTSLQRIRELAVQGNNDSQTPQDRQATATEVKQRLDELVQMANSQDGNGEYLFAGLKTRTQPFTKTGSTVTYNGDQGERSIQVGPGRQMPVTHSGMDIFMRMPNGNGTFVTSANAGNTGSASISSGSVTDPGALTGDAYSIDFSTSGGQTVYTVTDTTSGATVTSATPYSSGQAIKFAGQAVTISGEAKPGDQFTVQPSSSQSVFETVQNLANALDSGGTNSGQFHTAMDNALTEIDTAMNNVLRVRAESGARVNSLESESNANDAAKLDLQTTLSQVQDLDYAKAVSRLNLQSTGLKAAQQSYVKIQGLSLFNYL